MQPEVYFVITFDSLFLALRFEEVASKYNHQVKMIPVPRQIRTSCGLAARVHQDSITAMRALCDEKSIAYEHIYQFSAETCTRVL